MISTKFGVELEFYFPEKYKSPEAFSGALIYMLDKHGIEVGEYKPWKNSVCLTKKWFPTEDGSLTTDPNRGMEFVSPILRGERGLRELTKVVRALNTLECFTDKTCGLHVHVDSTSLSNVEKVAILTQYALYQKQINNFVAPHRRGKKCYSEDIDLAIIKRDIKESFIDSKEYYTDHGYKVSISDRFPTIEFRQHEGTLDEKKINYWVSFCLNFHKNTAVSFRKELKKKETDQPIDKSKLLDLLFEDMKKHDNFLKGLDKPIANYYKRLLKMA